MYPPLLKPRSGQWYLSVTCDSCNFKMLLFRDLNKGKGNTNGIFVVTCPRCGRDKNLPLEHYHHGERGNSKLPLAKFRA